MASRSVNKVFLLGNLTKDAEAKFTPGGVHVANLNLATNRRVKKGDEWADEAEFHRVTLWRSENVVQYLTKGAQVYIEGRLQTRSWDDKDGQKKYVTEIVADEVILCGGKGRSEQPSRPRHQPDPPFSSGPADEDVPW